MWGRKRDKDKVLSPAQVDAAALRMLSKRDYPVEELRQKLLERGGQKPDVDALITRFEGYGYLDDERVARRQVHLLSQRYGPLRIRQKLTHKGLANELVERFLDEIPEAHWVEVALHRLCRRFGEPKTLDLKERQRAYRHLAGRGYPGSVIRSAMEGRVDR